jgi:TonB family protein
MMKKALIASLVAHVIFLTGFFVRERALEKQRAREQAMSVPEKISPKVTSLTTRVLSQNEFDRVVETALVSKMNATPEDTARYRGERTQRVEREMRARGFGSAEGSPRTAKAAVPRASRPLLDNESLWRLPLEGTVREESERVGKDKLSKGTMDALDPTIALGTDTLLNTDEYIYAGFFNRVKREVGPRWEPAMQRFLRTTLTLNDGMFTTRWAFFVDAKGQLQDMQILESSGSRSLDDIAAKALREVGRFPNPPQSLRSAGGLYRVELGFVVQYTKKSFHADYVPDPRFRR